VAPSASPNECYLTAKRDGAIVLRVAYFLIATLFTLSLLRWYGFSPWTIENVTLLVSAIQWAHTVPLAIVVAIVYFRPTLSALLGKTTEAGYRDGGFYWKFDAAKERRRELANTSSKLTVADVKTLLKQVPGIRLDSVDKDAPTAHVWFLRNGITTRNMLEDLVNATEIFNILSQIYVDELGRSQQSPLDPVAVATWGSSLFIYGPRDDVIAALTQQIRSSPEGRRHRDENPE